MNQLDADRSSSVLASETRRVLVLIGVMVLLRMIGASSIPLLASEAYYWLWGQFPALGYFDHPPMVGWMSCLFFGWVKGSTLAARSSAIALSALSTGIVYLLTCELFKDRRVAWRATLVFSITPIFDIGGIILQPDNALMFFTACTWLLFWRASRPESHSLLAWLVTGVTAGLALLSKFHAWVLLPPLYLFLILSPPRRRHLATPGPWLAIVVSFVVLSPNLIWNMDHGWITYTYQSGRSGISKSHWDLTHPLGYLAGPMATLSPLIYIAMVAGIWKALRSRALREDPAVQYLLLAGLPLPFMFLLLCPFVSISLHWPAIGYVPLVILAVVLIERGELFSVRYERAAIATAVAMLALAHSVPFVARALPGSIAVPFYEEEANMGRLKAELMDWPRMGEQLRSIYEKESEGTPTFIMTRDFHLAALMSFYTQMPGAFEVMSEDREHQFKVWENRNGNDAGSRGLVLASAPLDKDGNERRDKELDRTERDVRKNFRSFTMGPAFPVQPHGEVSAAAPHTEWTRRYRVLIGNDYRGDRDEEAWARPRA